MNNLSHMLDFLVVASTFEFVTHLNLKYLKPIEKKNFKSKKENERNLPGLISPLWPTHPACWPISILPRLAHFLPPLFFFHRDTVIWPWVSATLSRLTVMWTKHDQLHPAHPNPHSHCLVDPRIHNRPYPLTDSTCNDRSVFRGDLLVDFPHADSTRGA
jgi:hypothetical protein